MFPRPTLHWLAPDDDSHVNDDRAPLARVAEAALCEDERAALAAYRFPKRRADWLLGRLAAKRALAEAEGAGRALAAYAILRGERGRPMFEAPDRALAGWDVSITHGHGHAAALVAPVPVGLDLEAVRPIGAQGWRFFLNDLERQQVAAGAFGADGDVLAWALKEAAYKALENRASSVLEIVLHEAAGGTARLGFGEVAIAARYARRGGFFLAMATPAPPIGSWWELVPLAGDPGAV